jgi:hypothetical protein
MKYLHHVKGFSMLRIGTGYQVPDTSKKTQQKKLGQVLKCEKMDSFISQPLIVL